MEPLDARERILAGKWTRCVAIALVFVMIVSALSAFLGAARAAPVSTSSPAASVAATSAPVAPTPSATSRTLKVGWIAMAIGTTNPIHITLDDEYVIVYNVYSTLITYDAQYHYKPDLAQKWWVYNSTAYEMYLSPDAYWTDPRNPSDTSHRVTGDDVKWSYETFANHTSEMDLFTDYVREIRNVWVDPTNHLHIIIDFKIPYAPAMETFGTMFILPKYIWQSQTLAWSNPLPIGSGPFMVRPDPAHPDKMLKPPPVLYLDRNPNWHGPKDLGWQIFPNTMEIDSYTTSAAMAQDLVLGVIDTVMSPEPTEWVYYLADKPGIIRQSVPHAFVAEVGINLMTPALRATNPQRFRGTNSPLLQNQVVRVALQMSINRQKMIDNALLGLGSKADTLVPTVSPWHYDFPDYASTMPNWANHSDPRIGPYTADEEFPDNTDAPGTQSSTYLARALLMKEGWKYNSAGSPATLTTTPLCKAGGADCLVFRFYTLSDVNWWKTAADGMVADAAKAGIQLNLALYGTTQMNNQIWWPMDYDIWLWDWMFTPAADPSTGILSVQTCENLVNGTANDNGLCLIDPTTHRWFYDDLYNQSIRTTDPGARRDLTNQMQSILYEYGGYSLPFYRKEIYAMNEVRWTHWGNWTQNPGLPEDVGLNTLLPGQVWPVDHKPPQVADLPTYTGVTGSPVQFSTAATDPNGVGLTYSWDFYNNVDVNHDGLWDNDNEATLPVASHTYMSAGTYTVTLRVSEVASNPDHWFTQKTTTVTIVDPSAGSPVVTGLSFGPDDPTILDQWVNFTAAAYDPQGRGLTYTWDFGDGTTAGPFTDPLVTHHFATAAVRTVKVTVTSSGGSAERSTIVNVVANTPPVVSPIADQQVQEGTLLTLTGFASDANSRDLLNYSWDFGDGATSWLNPAMHSYAAHGGSPTPYTLTLSVRDIPPFSSGPAHTTTVTAMITVIPRGPDQAPAVGFAANPPSATTTQDVTFTISAADPEGDPLRWSMDFNCANPKQCNNIAWTASTPQSRPGQELMQTVVHRYTTSGTFVATAFVDDLRKWNVSSQYTIIVSMNYVPTLTAITANPSPAIPHEVVTFSSVAADAGGDILTYQWNFGDSYDASGTTAPSGGLVTATHDYAAVGDYTVTLSVDDGKGGTAQRQYTLTIADINRPPTVSAIAAPHYALVGATVDFSADVNDPNGDTLAYTWDFGDLTAVETGTTPVPATLTAHHAFASEATFTVNLSVDDGRGGVAWKIVDVIVTNAPPTDTTPPVTTVAVSGTAGLAGWYTSAVTVTLSATDDISGVGWTNYSLDAAPWAPYTSSFLISADGSHTVRFNSTDLAGNPEATHSVIVNIDKTPPMMTDDESPSSMAGWYPSAVTVTLTSSDETSGVATERYRIDAGAWVTYTAPFLITAEGHHTLDYRVTDAAGLAYSNTLSVDIDLSAPVTTASEAGTLGANGWYTSPVSVALSAVDTLSGVAATEYRIDAGAWTSYTETLSLSTEGTHTVEFNSTDSVGHAEVTNSLTVKMDTTAPVTTAALSGTLSGGWYTTAVSVTLTASDGTSGVAVTQYRIDSGAWQDYSAPVDVTAEGSHTLEFNSTDNAGNVETTQASSLDVDLSGPTTMITLAGSAGSNGWYTSSVSVTLSSTDAGSGPGPISYRVDGSTWDTYSTSFTVSGEGTHTVEYNATDLVGHVESVKTTSVNIDTIAPTVSATPVGTAGSNGWYKSATTVSLSGTDATSGIASLSYRIDGGNWQTYTAAVDIPEGTHTFDARSTDHAGLVSAVQSLSLKVDSAPPMTGLSSLGLSGSNGWYKSAVNVTVTATDSASGVASTEYRIDGGAWQTYASGAVITVTDGTHTVEARSTDNAGWTGSTATATFKVDTAAPALSHLGPTGTVSSTSVTVHWTGSDSGSGIASYAVSVDGGAPQDLGTSNSTTLSLTAGDHTIRVTATDAAGNSVSQEWTLTVATPAGPTGGLDTTTIIAVVAVVAAAALGGVWYLMRRRKVSPPNEPPAIPPEP